MEPTAISSNFSVVMAEPFLMASLTAFTASLRSLFFIYGFLIAYAILS